MAITVSIPAPLRRYTDNQDNVSAAGATVGEVLENLVAQYSDLRKNFYDANGGLRRFVKVFKNEDDIDALDGTKTLVTDGDTLVIVPSIAGGSETVISDEAASAITFGPEEYRRYNRHMIMPEVGEDGQKDPAHAQTPA